MGMIGISGGSRFDYHPAAEFTGGHPGALWDVSKWRRWLFQDAAATVPVTASGQPVGCIRNVLGDTSWDLIQPTNANQPTFLIVGGVPRVSCAVNQGMYSRGVQSMVVPAFMACGMRHNDTGTIGRAILGIYKSDGSQFFLSNQTLGEVAADATGITPARSRATATSSPFSCPPNAMDAVGGTIDATGTVSVWQTDQPSTEIQAGINVAAGWANGDTIAGMTVALNASGQNSISKAATPNSDATTDFFGGMMLMGVAPANLQGNLHYFRRQNAPLETPRATDKVYTWNSDSTGDNQLNTTVFVEPPYKIATDYFVVNHPEASVFYVEWDRQYDKLSGVQRLSTGTTDARIYVYNFAASGSVPDYFMGERWGRSFGSLPHITAHFVNHGQNLAVAAPPTVYDSTGYLRRGDWFMHSDKLRKFFPATPQLYVRTYEVNIAGNTTIDAVLAALDAVVTAYADGTAESDVNAKFTADGNPSTYFQPDHVHLTSAGVQAYCDKAGPDITNFINALPAHVAPPLINQRKVTSNIVPNGLFDTWTLSTVPDGWTLNGCTAAHSVDFVDTEKGDRASCKLAGNGYIEFDFNAVPYRGQALCFYFRLYIPSGTGDLISGQVQFLDDSPTATASHGNSWVKTFNAKPVDAWIEYGLCTKPIPADASTGKVRIFGGSGAAGLAYVGRCIGSVGSTPRDLLS